tara:strand:- start:2352 stop:2735 length:384 start_codon:yes stop_codon:yes gene_type:complete
MAKVTIKIDDKAFKKQLNNIVKYTEDTMVDKMVEVYRENTPQGGPPPAGTKGGNARQNTKRKGNSVVAKYPYAGVLDDGLFPRSPRAGYGKTSGGYSTQAPKGMAEPTIKQIQKLFNKYVKKIWKRT